MRRLRSPATVTSIVLAIGLVVWWFLGLDGRQAASLIPDTPSSTEGRVESETSDALQADTGSVREPVTSAPAAPGPDAHDSIEIRGLVSDTRDAPLEGVLVKVRDPNGQEFECTTDASGIYSYRLARPMDTLFVTAQGDGRAVVTVQCFRAFFRPEHATFEIPVLRLPRAYRVEGSIVDVRTREPVAGILVLRLMDDSVPQAPRTTARSGWIRTDPKSVSVHSNAEDGFAAMLPVGRWSIDLANSTRVLLNKELVVDGPLSLEIATTEPASIQGEVVDSDGRPVVGDFSVGVESDERPVSGTVRLRLRHEFVLRSTAALDALRAVRVVVRSEKDGTELGSTTAAWGDDDVRVVAALGRQCLFDVRSEVDGHAVSGCKISLTRSREDLDYRIAPESSPGTYSRFVSGPGEYWLRVLVGEGALRLHGPELIRVEPEPNQNHFSVRLASGRAVTIRSITSGGGAVPNASVSVLDRRPGARDLTPFQAVVPLGPERLRADAVRRFFSGRTDEDGRVRVALRSADARWVLVACRGFASRLLELPPVGEDLVVPLEPAQGVALSIDPQPRDGVRSGNRILLESTDGDVWPLDRQPLRLASDHVTTLEDVPAGVWRIHVFGAFADLLQSPWFEVASEDRSVALDLAAIRPVKLAIVLQDNETAVKKRLMAPTASYQTSQRNGSGGVVEFSALPPGNWEFELQTGSGEVSRTLRVELLPGETVEL